VKEPHIPSISVGLPVHNGEKFVEDAIKAILSQTFKDFELIISDNASTDRTWEICSRYAGMDERVRCYRNERNLGVATNFNNTVRLARGRYFRWAAYDDLMAPGLLGSCLAVLDREPDVVLCYPKTVNIDDNGNILFNYEDNFGFRSPNAHERFKDAMLALRDNECNALYGVIRCDVLRKTSMIQDYHSADRVLLAELTLHGQFYEVPERLFFHRIHKNISTRPGMTARGLAVWFNPSNRAKRTFPVFRRFIEFFKAVNRAPLSLYQRVYCYLQILRFYGSRDKWERLFRKVHSLLRKERPVEITSPRP
jgi:glycosyltransferase involved in cell wall biosynthesis